MIASAPHRPRCLTVPKRIAAINLWRSVLVIVVSRAWSDLLYEIVVPSLEGVGFHHASGCHTRILYATFVLGAGSFATYVASHSRWAASSGAELLPAVVGMCASGAITPAALECMTSASHQQPPQAMRELRLALSITYCIACVSVYSLMVRAKKLAQATRLRKSLHLAWNVAGTQTAPAGGATHPVSMTIGCAVSPRATRGGAQARGQVRLLQHKLMLGATSYSVRLLQLASSFLALSSAALLNDATRASLAWADPAYVDAYSAARLHETRHHSGAPAAPPQCSPQRLPSPQLLAFLWAALWYLLLPRVLAALQATATAATSATPLHLDSPSAKPAAPPPASPPAPPPASPPASPPVSLPGLPHRSVAGAPPTVPPNAPLTAPTALPPLAPVASLLEFTTKLFAFFAGFQTLTWVELLWAQHLHGLAPLAAAPLAEMVVRCATIAAFLLLYVLTRGPMQSLGALTKAQTVWTRDAIESIFMQHAIGMALGWSWQPVIKALFLQLGGRFAAHEGAAMTAYAAAATALGSAAYAQAWRWSHEMQTNGSQSAADAGYTDGEGGAGGGGGGGLAFGDAGDGGDAGGD